MIEPTDWVQMAATEQTAEMSQRADTVAAQHIASVTSPQPLKAEAQRHAVHLCTLVLTEEHEGRGRPLGGVLQASKGTSRLCVGCGGGGGLSKSCLDAVDMRAMQQGMTGVTGAGPGGQSMPSTGEKVGSRHSRYWLSMMVWHVPLRARRKRSC